MPKSKSLWTLAVIGLVVFGAAACVDDSKPAAGTSGNPVPSASSSESLSESESGSENAQVNVAAVEASPGTFVYDTAGVESVPAGPVEFSFHNSANQRHEARLVRVLNGNVDEYTAAVLANGEQGAAALGQEVARAGPLEPGGTATQTVDLPAGVYVIVDFEKLDDGSTYAQHGLIRELAAVPE